MGISRPGYAAEREQLAKRLARIEGQVRGVAKMVEEERYCIDVLTQIQAAQAALDRVALALLDDHIHECVANADDQPAKLTELMDAVARMTR